MMTRVLTCALLLIVTTSCRQSEKNKSGGAVDHAAQCQAQGADFQWRGGVCTNIAAERECLNRQNHIWSNGVCLPQSASNPEADCISRGGVWREGRCLIGNDIYNNCHQMPSFRETLTCIEQGTANFRQRLSNQSQSVRNLESASGQFDNLSQKASSLASRGVTSDMSGMAKVRACWDTSSMASSLRQIAGQLEFSDTQLRDQAQNYVTGMRTAVRHLQDHINCPIKI